MFMSSQNLVETTSKLFRTRKHVDAKIILDDGTVHEIHKFLLARDCLFFYKLFTHQQGREYRLQMVAKTEFVQVLEWIYEVGRFDL
jgi:hypothetical protein